MQSKFENMISPKCKKGVFNNLTVTKSYDKMKLSKHPTLNNSFKIVILEAINIEYHILI